MQWAQLLFSDVVGIAAGGGAIYFSEPLLNQVRKIDQDGKIKTVAGKGTSGFAPNGWDALAAPLQRPTALAFGPEGSLYIANTADPVLGGGHHINRVDTAGLIWVAAGTGGPGFSGDGGLATNAQLARPNDIAIAPDGAIFIADTGNKRIRKVTTDGIIRTVAGVNNPWISACSETNVPATNTNLCGPTGVAVGPATSDEFYIADNGVRPLVRKVSTDGNIRTLAGGGGSFPPFEGSHPARQVRFGRLTRLAVGLEGHIYVLDAYLRRIFLLTPNTAGTEYWISTYFGGKQDNKDCGGGLLEGISTLENLDVRLRATLSTMCAGHPTAISISHSCGEPKGVVNIFFSQVFGQHWAGNIIHVTRPCSQ